MGDASYVSRVRIKRSAGRSGLLIYGPSVSRWRSGCTREVAEQYGVSAADYPPHASTRHYVVAAGG